MATYFSYNLAVNVAATGFSYSYTNNTGKHILLNINLLCINGTGFSTYHEGTATTSGGGGVNRIYVCYSFTHDGSTPQTVGGSTMIVLIPGQTVTLNNSTNASSGAIYLTGFSISN